MSLRPARPADAPAVTKVFQAARDHSLPYLPKLHTDAEDHAFFARIVKTGGVTVAEADGAVVGFLALSGDEVDHLYIDPAHHRQGHGSALLRAAQATNADLELWVFQRNADAIAFYAAHGFAIARSTDGADNEEHEPDHRMTWSLR
ncbi:MAG TPA: GNAT family N-acetyltransferase [Solirubrobacter sp.]